MIRATFGAVCLLQALLAACPVNAGPSSATSTSGDTHFAFENAKDTRIYLLVGQSNMAGRGEISEVDRTTHPRVFMLDRKGHWVPASEPLHFDKPKVAGVGPGLAFGKAMADLHPDAFIGLIPSAVGGSVIDSWRPSGFHAQTGVFPYDDSIKRVKIATQGGRRISGILWHQGENDSRRDKADLYASEIARLASEFRRDIGQGEVPFLVGGLGDFLLVRNSDAHTVQSALMAAPEYIECSAFVSTEGLGDKGDELHFNADSQREIGWRYANAAISLERQKKCSGDSGK